MTGAVGQLRRGFARMHRRVRGETGDEGATMIEMFVAMIIMTICGSIFIGAVVTLNRTSSQAQAINNSAQENNKAYQTLERTVRYASAISEPGVSTGLGAKGYWYVEMRDVTEGTEVCTQLRVNTTAQLLERRSWKAATPPAPDVGWVPLAAGVTNGGAAASSPTQPFVLEQPTSTAKHQRLSITLITRSGPASGPVSSRSSYALSALNSTVPPSTGAICQGAGRE